MKLPIEVRMTRDAYIAKFPFPRSNNLPTPEAVEQFEGEFRNWFGKLIQQIVFSHPNGNFVWKSSSPSNPPSKDFMGQTGGTFHGWDMFGGVGTGSPSLNTDPDSQDVPGQNPIVVTGVDYLNGNPVIPPIVVGPAATDDKVYNKLVEILEEFSGLAATVEVIKEQQDAQTLKLVQGLSDIKDAVSKGIKVRF